MKTGEGVHWGRFVRTQQKVSWEVLSHLLESWDEKNNLHFTFPYRTRNYTIKPNNYNILGCQNLRTRAMFIILGNHNQNFRAP